MPSCNCQLTLPAICTTLDSKENNISSNNIFEKKTETKCKLCNASKINFSKIDKSESSINYKYGDLGRISEKVCGSAHYDKLHDVRDHLLLQTGPDKSCKHGMDRVIVNNIGQQENKNVDHFKNKNREHTATTSILSTESLTGAKDNIGNKVEYEKSISIEKKATREKRRGSYMDSSTFSCDSNQEREAYCQDLERKYVHDVYNRTAHHFANAKYRAWPRVQQFLEELDPGSLVSDIGCGHGKYLNINDTICKIGSDHSLKLANIAADKGHQVLVCDNLNLPYRSNSFDAVISIGVIHHFTTIERRLQAISELARILRPGGKLMIYVWALEQKYRKFCAQDVLVPWHLKQKEAKAYRKIYEVNSFREDGANAAMIITKQATLSFVDSKYSSKMSSTSMSKVNELSSYCEFSSNNSSQNIGEVFLNETKPDLFKSNSKDCQQENVHLSKEMLAESSDLCNDKKTYKQSSTDESANSRSHITPLQCSFDITSDSCCMTSYTQKGGQIPETSTNESFNLGSFIKKKLSSIFMPGKFKKDENNKFSVMKTDSVPKIENSRDFQSDLVPGNFAVREFPMSSQPVSDSILPHNEYEEILQNSVFKLPRPKEQQCFIQERGEKTNSLGFFSNDTHGSVSMTHKCSYHLKNEDTTLTSSAEQLLSKSIISNCDNSEGQTMYDSVKSKADMSTSKSGHQHNIKSENNTLPVMFTLGETFSESDSEWITTTSTAIHKIQSEVSKNHNKMQVHCDKSVVINNESTVLMKATPKLIRRNFSQSSSVSSFSSDNFSDSEVEETLFTNCKTQNNCDDQFCAKNQTNGQNGNIEKDCTSGVNLFREKSEKKDQHTNEIDENGDTFKRYYHVFKENELDDLISKHLKCLHIVSSTYDHANWCVIAQKKSCS